MTENLINRITYHLSSGGLFNPELADHLAVRNLLMECRDALAQPEQLREENERLHVENRRLIDRIETIGVPVGVGGFATTTSVQPEQEPVAWYDSKTGWTDFHSFKPARKPSSPDAEWLPLYSTPPQRKPLTDEEIYKASTEAGMQEHYMGFHSGFIRFARAIEAAHGIKGEA